jgi:thymidylate kinase
VTLVAQSPAVDAPLLTCVAEALDSERIRYCQWKGHFKQATWITGKGDIDLLVAPESLARFVEVLRLAGFVQTTNLDDYKLLGTAHYRAHDPATGRMLHLHVHTRILIEAARGLVYRLPFEDAMIASARRGSATLFRTPAPGVEAVVLVLRTTVRWASWRRIPTETREELAYLEGLTDSRYYVDALRRHAPGISPELFRQCRAALAAGATLRERWLARLGLTRALAAFSRPPTLTERVIHALAAAAWHLRGGPRPYSRARLTNGGVVFALVGADGAGKSTCARALKEWLTPHVDVRAFHMGRPRRSLATLVVGGALKLAPRVPALRLLRHVCSARDRWLLARTVHAAAMNGAICIVERYPIPLNRQLVGPWIPELYHGNPPAGVPRLLAAAEARYYHRIPSPNVVITLQIAPHDAVRRKTDEPADYVRARADLVWKIDWTASGARVVDAGRPLPAVLADLRTVIWETLQPCR